MPWLGLSRDIQLKRISSCMILFRERVDISKRGGSTTGKKEEVCLLWDDRVADEETSGMRNCSVWTDRPCQAWMGCSDFLQWAPGKSTLTWWTGFEICRGEAPSGKQNSIRGWHSPESPADPWGKAVRVCQEWIWRVGQARSRLGPGALYRFFAVKSFSPAITIFLYFSWIRLLSNSHSSFSIASFSASVK